MLHIFRNNDSDIAVNVNRVALRSIANVCNMRIINLAARELRRRRFGEAAEPTGKAAGYGVQVGIEGVSRIGEQPGQLTVDHANDEAAARTETSNVMRDHQGASTGVTQYSNPEEQGFDPGEDPMVTAGKLMLIRNAAAEFLTKHARMRRNPLDPKGGLYIDPYDVAQPLSDSMNFMISQTQAQSRTTPLQAEAIAKALGQGVTAEDVLRIEAESAERGAKFIRDNADEILAIAEGAQAVDANGKAYDLEDDENVFEMLPYPVQLGLCVSSDKALFRERDRQIGMFARGVADAATAIAVINGTRRVLHDWFHTRMRKPEVKREIEEAVARGANMPVLLFLPKVEGEEDKAARVALENRIANEQRKKLAVLASKFPGANRSAA